MKIGLSVGDRILLLGLLPRESNIVTLRTVRDLEHAVGFQEAEYDEFALKIEAKDGNTVAKWDPEKGKVEKEFEFSDRARTLVADALKALDAKKQLTSTHIALWEKFVGE